MIAISLLIKITRYAIENIAIKKSKKLEIENKFSDLKKDIRAKYGR